MDFVKCSLSSAKIMQFARLTKSAVGIFPAALGYGVISHVYFATATERTSLITVIFTCPG